MIADYKIISITHHALSVNELDRYMIRHGSEQELILKLEQAKSRFGISELLYLSTCNRVLFLMYADLNMDRSMLQKFFQYLNPELSFEPSNLDFIQTYDGPDAVAYMMRVAASLDSLVVGEREVFRQFRKAYGMCQSARLTGDYLRILERFVVQSTKKILTETSIGDRSVSIVSLAASKMLSLNPSKDVRVLMIGAGEMNRLFAKWLAKHGLERVHIFNRSLSNAQAIKSLIPTAEIHELTELRDYTDGFDILISCTGSKDHLVDTDIYKTLLNGEQDKKLLIDLSVPNNIDKAITKKYRVHLIDIEELRSLAEVNLSLRKKAVREAEVILQKQAESFKLTYSQREIEKKFRQLPNLMGAIKERAMTSVYHDRIQELPQESQELIAEMMEYMVKKCVSIPMKVAREAALTESSASRVSDQ